DTPTLPHIYAGWVIKEQDNKFVKLNCWDMGEGPDMSANIAEYGAVRSSLYWLYKNYDAKELDVVVKSDSQLVIRQINGTYTCNAPHLKIWLANVLELCQYFKSVKFEWIPRELNKEADFISKCKQIKYGAKVPDTYEELLERMQSL
ncbi:MAG TPA: ribonuclease HI family protein, partial [Legionellaceae bacterium]|nr:ribonuclease HI family protein [Legionellaceae bacterium]